MILHTLKNKKYIKNLFGLYPNNFWTLRIPVLDSKARVKAPWKGSFYNVDAILIEVLLCIGQRAISEPCVDRLGAPHAGDQLPPPE